MSDILLETIEFETAENPTASVIWMHGLGADGNDFVPLVRELPLPDRSIRFVFPHAPKRPVTVNGGFVMRAWYDVAGNDLAHEEDEEGLRMSQEEVESLIEREKERGIEARSIVLAGFSQGGAMAFQIGLRYPERLAALVILSAYVPLAKTLEAERSAANADVPIFMAHGIGDPVIPLRLATTSRERLTSLGYEVEWHSYPMPHSVCEPEIEDVGAFLSRILSI